MLSILNFSRPAEICGSLLLTLTSVNRRTIKDMKESSLTHQERKAAIIRVLIITLILNLVVAGAKLFYGSFSGAISVLADGFHSLMDSTSNIVGLIAIRFAYAPPDAEHNYGHRKAEVLASTMIAIMLGVTCLEIIKALIERLLNPVVPHVSGVGFVIMLAGLGINTLVVWYESRQGRRLNSQLLLSDAEHTRSDVLVTLSVMASMWAITRRWFWLDNLVSLGIVFVIGHIAFKLLRQNIDVLMDRTPVDCEAIKQIVEAQEGVNHCHKVRAHGSPDEVYMELHIWVNPKWSIDQAHELSHKVKNQLMELRPELADVTIHVEPDERSLETAPTVSDFRN